MDGHLYQPAQVLEADGWRDGKASLFDEVYTIAAIC